MRRPSIREQLRRRGPARAAAGKKTFEKPPGVLAVLRVMREPADRLAASEVVHSERERLRLADEALAFAPDDEVDMRVHLQDSGRGLGRGARAVGAQAAQPRGGQLAQELGAKAVPGWREHRQGTPPRQP